MKLLSSLSLGLVLFLAACASEAPQPLPTPVSSQEQLRTKLTAQLKELDALIRDDGVKQDFYQGLLAAEKSAGYLLGHIDDHKKFVFAKDARETVILFNESRHYLAAFLKDNFFAKGAQLELTTAQAERAARVLANLLDAPAYIALLKEWDAPKVQAGSIMLGLGGKRYIDPLVLKFVEQNLAKVTIYLGIIFGKKYEPVFSPLKPSKQEQATAAKDLRWQMNLLQTSYLSNPRSGFGRYKDDAWTAVVQARLNQLRKSYLKNKKHLKFTTHQAVLLVGTLYVDDLQQAGETLESWQDAIFVYEKLLSYVLKAVL